MAPLLATNLGSVSSDPISPIHANLDVFVSVYRYTKLGFAGNTEPQFIMPSGQFLTVNTVLTVCVTLCQC